MGHKEVIGRNPYGAKYKALAFEDLRPGLQVVVIGGGLDYHEHLTIASTPYRREHNGLSDNLRQLGQSVRLTSWFVKITGASVPSKEESLPDWYKGMEALHRSRQEERFLSDMGLCPGRDGRWSLKYTVRRSDYDPRGLHR